MFCTAVSVTCSWILLKCVLAWPIWWAGGGLLKHRTSALGLKHKLQTGGSGGSVVQLQNKCSGAKGCTGAEQPRWGAERKQQHLPIITQLFRQPRDLQGLPLKAGMLQGEMSAKMLQYGLHPSWYWYILIYALPPMLFLRLIPLSETAAVV